VNSRVSRRRILFLAGAAVRLRAAGEDFWNTKPPSQWDAGEIYQLLNHSPWADSTDWWHPTPRKTPQANVATVVTWESARPIRDALKTRPAPVYQNYYVIGVDGLPSGDYSPDYLSQFAVLRSRRKSKWTARAASARERIRTSSVCQFAFPRGSAPIGPETEEVIFEMNLEPWMLQARFKPREMLYRGELAL
jgi:hypothetical protein